MLLQNCKDFEKPTQHNCRGDLSKSRLGDVPSLLKLFLSQGFWYLLFTFKLSFYPKKISANSVTAYTTRNFKIKKILNLTFAKDVQNNWLNWEKKTPKLIIQLEELAKQYKEEKNKTPTAAWLAEQMNLSVHSIYRLQREMSGNPIIRKNKYKCRRRPASIDDRFKGSGWDNCHMAFNRKPPYSIFG